MNLGVPISTAAEESAPAISEDARSLYLNRDLNVPVDNDDVPLRVAARGTRHEEWGDPLPLVTANTPAFNQRNATLSRDGLLMFFSQRTAPRLAAGLPTTSTSSV